LPRLERRHLGDDAGDRRAHGGMRELACGLIARGHCILIARMVLNRSFGVAVEVRCQRRKLFLDRCEFLLRGRKIVPRIVVGRLRREVVGRKLLLALESDRIIIDVGLSLRDLRLHVAIIRLQRGEIVADAAELRFGAIESETILPVVQTKQYVPLTSVATPTVSACT